VYRDGSVEGEKYHPFQLSEEAVRDAVDEEEIVAGIQ